MRVGKSWKRIKVKNDASLNFFVLHGFLREIGFVDWVSHRKDDYTFPQLMSSKDPTKGASAHIQRLFKTACVISRKEIFHSRRGGDIAQMRLAKLEPRTIRMQAGHQIGINEHELLQPHEHQTNSTVLHERLWKVMAMRIERDIHVKVACRVASYDDFGPVTNDQTEGVRRGSPLFDEVRLLSHFPD